MNFVAEFYERVTGLCRWIFDGSYERPAVKRKRRYVEVNENIPPKRRKVIHNCTQTENCSGGRFAQFTSRADKIQSLTTLGSFYSHSPKTYLRQPKSWNLDMDDIIEFSSDDDDNNDVQVICEAPSPRNRNPLSSSTAKNQLTPGASEDDGVQVLKVLKKGKNVQLNGTHVQSSFRTSTPSSLNSSHRAVGCARKVHSTPKSTPRMQTINVMTEMDSKERYNALLKAYLGRTAVPALTPSFSNLRNAEEKVLLNLKPESNGATPKIKFVDLTQSEVKRRPVHISVKPAQPKPDDDDSDIELISIQPVPRVNSYEEKLKSNKFVLPEWIKEFQASWKEKTEEIVRQSKEEQLRKNMFAERNQKQLDAIEERVRHYMSITDPAPVEEVVTTKLPELTPEMEERISAALVGRPPDEVLAEGFNLRITRKDMNTLAGCNWLNDEVINFYMNLLMERGKEEKKLKIYAFNTFFYMKLQDHGYNSVKRWTKKVDIFTYNLIVLPLHLQHVHWCLAIIDFDKKCIEYYDSMGNPNQRCLDALLKYLQLESMDKKNTPLDTPNWKTKHMTDIPQQMNGSDCGVFACTYAEYRCRKAKINFTQEDMPYFRRKMVYEILIGRLMIN